MFVIMMLVIGIVVKNHLWLYLALGLEGFAVLGRLAERGRKVQAATKNANDAVETFLKSLKSQQN